MIRTAVLFMTLVGWAVAPSAAVAATDCTAADALRDVEDFDGANTAYVQLLSGDTLECAKAGILSLPARRASAALKLAEAYEREGFREPALEQIKKAIAADPTVSIPPSLSSLARAHARQQLLDKAKALAAIGQYADANTAIKQAVELDPRSALPAELQQLAREQLLDKARALAAIGQYADANTAIKQAVELDPRSALPADLQQLATGLATESRPAVWQGFVYSAMPWLRAATDAAGGLIVVAVILSAANLVLSRRLVIGKFAGESDELNNALTVLLREKFHHLNREIGGNSLRMVTESGSELKTPMLEAIALPQVKALATALQALIGLMPNRSLSVSAYVHKPAERGPGLTLSLSRFGFAKSQVTIWESDLAGLRRIDEATPSGKGTPIGDDSARYRRLVLPAAVWLVYETQPSDFSWLGTADWSSYAAFALGAEIHESDRPGARRSYLDALQRDPRNRGALLNVATLDLYEADVGARRDPQVTSRAIGMIRTARDSIVAAPEPAGPLTNDRMWYRTSFTLVAAQLNEHAAAASRPNAPRKMLPEEPDRVASELVCAMVSQNPLTERSATAPRPRAEAKQTAAETARGALKPMIQERGTWTYTPTPWGRGADGPAMLRSLPNSLELRRWALLKEREAVILLAGVKAERDPALGAPQDGQPGRMPTRAELSDPKRLRELTHAQLIAYVTDLGGELSYREHLQLASYWCVMGRQLEETDGPAAEQALHEATRNLRIGLRSILQLEGVAKREGKELPERARWILERDPALEPLRQKGRLTLLEAELRGALGWKVEPATRPDRRVSLRAGHAGGSVARQTR